MELNVNPRSAVWKASRNGHGALPIWWATALSSLKQLRRRDQVNAFGRRPFAECWRELVPAENDQARCHSVTAKSCLVVAQLVKCVGVHDAAPLARSEQRVAVAAGSDDVDLGLAVS